MSQAGIARAGPQFRKGGPCSGASGSASPTSYRRRSKLDRPQQPPKPSEQQEFSVREAVGSAGPTLPVVPRTPARVEGIWRQGGCHFCPLARREPFTQVAEAICDHCTELRCQGSRQAGGPWPPRCGTWGHRQEVAEWFGQQLCWWEKPRNHVQELRTRVRGARSQGGPWGGVVGSGVSCIGAALFLPPDLWQWSFPLPFPAWVGDSSLPARALKLPTLAICRS